VVDPNGYAWWYLDALSHDRQYGVTIIAFVGSVFSPFYARARRTSGRVDPHEFCAFNVAVYGAGPGSWAFNEYPAARVIRGRNLFVMGNSGMKWDGSQLRVWFDEPAAPIGVPVRGEVLLEPTRLFDTVWQLDPAGHHHWQPIAPGAKVSVSLDRPDISFEGIGYHDTNQGARPLECDFESWNWSRVELEEGTAILYDVHYPDGSTRPWGRLFGHEGDIVTIDPAHATDLGRGRWRVDRATRSDARGTARVARVLEDTPFYTRSVLETTLLGQRAEGVHESLDMRRFQQRWVQHLLTYRMRRRS